MHLLSAQLQARNRIVLRFDHTVGHLTAADITVAPRVRIAALESLENVCVLHTDELDLRKSYTLFVHNAGSAPVIPDGVFDSCVSDKELGCTRAGGLLVFRLFAPRATSVILQLQATLDDAFGTLFAMDMDESGVWEIALDEQPEWNYYSYRVDAPPAPGMELDLPGPIADPYARAVVTRNSYRHEARAVLPMRIPDFDWGDDAPVPVAARDLVIYEMHVRDMTAHASSDVGEEHAGTYTGLAAARGCGGIGYLSELGVNAVELLPVQHFASIEPPYMQRTSEGLCNTWNPYERNHWGYMTSYFFAPEPTYATGSVSQPGLWNDVSCRHVTELKSLIKSLHAAGIAVILDVVYNHTSQYDEQPLKRIDALYYYRTDPRGNLSNGSGCGNDLHTARPMARRLIVESIAHWMTEYHVDGFRFDLAAMIDDETFAAIRAHAESINPHVVLIAEPWGGGAYDLARFSRLNMPSWNDVFRNGVKGVSPSAPGFIFGHWGWNPPEAFGRWILGCITESGGPLHDAAHSVNYLASHDGYTLGDFVRLGCGEAREHQPVRDQTKNALLSGTQLRIQRLAACMLFVSQGAVMIHHGQEFGRSKVIARRRLSGTTPGMLDHNSYEKDDETNWINWLHADLNADLLAYYRGLIALRAALRPLRHAPPRAYTFLVPDVPVASGFVIDAPVPLGDMIAVLLNANHGATARYTLPEGLWRVYADAERAGVTAIRSLQGGSVDVPAGTAMVLVRASAVVFRDADTAH